MPSSHSSHDAQTIPMEAARGSSFPLVQREFFSFCVEVALGVQALGFVKCLCVVHMANGMISIKKGEVD